MTATSTAVVCDGQYVTDAGVPDGPACGNRFRGKGYAPLLDQARAAGWRLSAPAPDGSRQAMCPSCARPDPAIARGLTTPKE